MKICIPSYNRADRCITAQYLKQAIICCPKSQVEAYKKYGNEILEFPDELEGNIARKRNFILEHFSGSVCMIDDDIGFFAFYEDCVPNRLPEKKVYEFIDSFTELCIESGSVLWGISLNMDKRLYRENSPFSFVSPVLGPFCVHVENPIRYDERFTLKEDYDMSLEVLNKYRRILRVNKYFHNAGHKDNKGGITQVRTSDREKEQAHLLLKKWGSQIVSFKKGDINPIIRVPIAGV